jgi:hypothetical protein
MLNLTRDAILAQIEDHHLVLDIGGWADPFERSDWVMDFLPYETRGFYERAGWREPGPLPPERFTADTWVTRDICDHEPYPFEDEQFDFVICSHTLEDVHDPMWVCSEMSRVAKAGYISVPSRLEEQSWGVEGPYAGYAHHHWLVDIDPTRSHVEFAFKAHDLHSSSAFHFPASFGASLTDEERLQELAWQGTFTWAQRSLVFPEERHAYFAEFVSRERGRRPATKPARSRLRHRLAHLR